MLLVSWFPALRCLSLPVFCFNTAVLKRLDPDPMSRRIISQEIILDALNQLLGRVKYLVRCVS
jgi:hypothetical protein